MLLKLLKRAFQGRSSSGIPRARAEANAQGQAAELARRTPELLATAINHAQRGELAHAMGLVSQVLAVEPQHAGAHDVLGNVLRCQDRIDEALASYERAVRIDPVMPTAQSNLALCLRDLGRFEEARLHFEEAARIDPANPMIATNLAALLFDTGHFDEAAARIETVLAQYPDHQEAHVVRGTRLLRRGDYARGWIDYEWRDRDAGRDPANAFDYPLWDGSPIADKKLLVCCEQGLGDQIMFASCFTDLQRVAPRCIVECDARLKALFVRSFPDLRFFVQRQNGEQAWLRDGLVPSAKTWSGSLPGWFRRQAADFPKRTSYLQADAGKVAGWTRELQRLGPGLKIGISWRGGTGGTRRALRSLALEEWIPLLKHPGMHFISLQYGDCGEEIDRIRAAAELTISHWDAAIRDYDETAALVSALDLVISVQTAVVHLAGALGKPVWVLVPSIAEWRYGESGERMPWYPAARLYRQSRPGDWGEVIGRLRAALRTRTFEHP